MLSRLMHSLLVSLLVLLVLAIRPIPSAVAQGTVGCATDAIVCRVSLSSDGAQGNYDSGFYNSALSADGRLIAFPSYAGNLVPNDTNNMQDIFVHDRQTGTTTRVSVGSNGQQANDWSFEPSMTADGRYVTFVSIASTIVPDDTNNALDTFIHDRQTATTTRASVAAGTPDSDGAAINDAVSSDARYVTFTALTGSIISGDTSNIVAVFARDRQTGTTTLISISSTGVAGNGRSFDPSITPDGRLIVFSSAATNLVSDDTNGEEDIFVHDRQTAMTTRVSLATNGDQSNGQSVYADISADGRYIVYETYASNLVVGDTNGVPDVLLHDRQTGDTTRVSVNMSGTQGNNKAYLASISVDGRYVAFVSLASNLVTDDTNNNYDIFVRDLRTGVTRRVSLNADGEQGNDRSYMFPAFSADGHIIAYESLADNLVADDTNERADVFVVDWQRLTRIDGTVTLQGRSAANLTVHMFMTPQVTGMPILDQTVSLSDQGGFSVRGLRYGEYSVRTKYAHNLSACQVVTIDGSQALTLPILQAGDANNDDRVNITDFSILAATFGRVSGAPGFDVRADFNDDSVVNISDFSLLASSFGQTGCTSP